MALSRGATIMVLGFSILTSAFGAKREFSATDVSMISAFVEDVMQCRHIPGLTLSVVRSGRVLLERGFGFADVESKRRVDTKTLFPIASTTKSFTVTLLAMLLEESR